MASLRTLAYRAEMALHPRALSWGWRKKHTPGSPLVASLRGGQKLRVYPSYVIGKEIYVRGMHESAQTRFVRSFLKPAMTFIDGGANIGYYSVIAAALTYPAKVHSFEPGARMFEELTANVALNGMEQSCILNKAALGEKPGTARLSMYAPGFEVYSSLAEHKWINTAPIGYEEVAVVTLDDYVRQNGIDRVDLLKLDIEGAELLALRGATDLLGRLRPVLMIELADVNTAGFGYRAAEVVELLTGFGYRFNSIGRDGSVTPIDPPRGEVCSDFVVTPPGK